MYVLYHPILFLHFLHNAVNKTTACFCDAFYRSLPVHKEHHELEIPGYCMITTGNPHWKREVEVGFRSLDALSVDELQALGFFATAKLK